jgi:tRNA threonylcarbamoyladenosine biosynthesis protein TsaB
MTLKTLILAVETSSRVGSVAIATGPQLLGEVTFSGQMKHSSEIFSAICTLLDRFSRSPEEIEQVYISFGPGSFTGLRIAVTLAKAMHLTNSAKIVPVNTLDVIAANVINLDSANYELRESNIEHRASSIELIAPILDAKRGQFYIAVYQKTRDERRETKDEIWNKLLPDSLMTTDEFLDKFACKENPIWLLGDGLLYHKDKFKADGVCFFDEKFWSPRASKVHCLGWQLALANKFADPILLVPNYLLRPDITLKRR